MKRKELEKVDVSNEKAKFIVGLTLMSVAIYIFIMILFLLG